MSDTNVLQTHRIMVGDTLTPLGVVLKQSDRAVDLSGKTVKVVGKTSAGAEWIAEATTGVTAEAAQTVTFGSGGYITLVRHTFKIGDEVRFTTTGALPSELTAGTAYWVKDTRGDTFRVAAYPGGPAIEFSSGSGTQSVIRIGGVQYDFQTADVDTAGTFSLYFRVYSGSEFDTFPCDGRKLEVEITAQT